MKTKLSEVDYFDKIGSLYEIKSELGDQVSYVVESPAVTTYTPIEHNSAQEAVMAFIAHLQHQQISNCAKGMCGQ